MVPGHQGRSNDGLFVNNLLSIYKLGEGSTFIVSLLIKQYRKYREKKDEKCTFLLPVIFDATSC